MAIILICEWMLDLSKADGKVDLVVPETSRQWRTLPPSLSPVHGILRLVTLTRFARVAIITQLSLDHLELPDHVLFVWVGAGQLAVELWFRHADTARRSRFNLATDGQVKVGRR